MIPHAHNSEIEHSDITQLTIGKPVKHKRLYYLDWLRVLAVVGVFVAHTADIFDTLYWHTRQGGGGGSLPDTFFYKRVMKEKRPYLGDGGEEQKTRSSVQTEKLNLFGGRPQWMHLVYSG